MVDPLFEVAPFGDRWAVTSREEVLMVTRTKPEARRLAREAEKLLVPANPSSEDGAADHRLEEPRSFAPPKA